MPNNCCPSSQQLFFMPLGNCPFPPCLDGIFCHSTPPTFLVPPSVSSESPLTSELWLLSTYSRLISSYSALLVCQQKTRNADCAKPADRHVQNYYDYRVNECTMELLWCDSRLPVRQDLLSLAHFVTSFYVFEKINIHFQRFCCT